MEIKWIRKYTIFFSLICLMSAKVYGVEVSVDASREIGPVPEIFSSSIWLTYIEQNDKYTLEKFLRETKPAVIQFTITKILRDSKNFIDFQRLLREYFMSDIGSFLTEMARVKNIKLIIGFDPRGMPNWLSSRPGLSMPISEGITIESVSPPKDYELWGNVVQYAMELLFNELKIKNLGFYAGHEPNDRDWAGSEESFFKYYEAAAKAAKKVSNDISVGGIGVWSVEAVKSSCKEYSDNARKICQKEGGWSDPNGDPMLKNFLKYVAKRRVPLDFINWHSFRALHIGLKEAQISAISGWIEESGLSRKDIKLYPSDWSYWTMSAKGYPADYLDTEESAAYIIHSLYGMWGSGIEWSGYDFNVRNPSREEEVIGKRKGATFIGDWPLFTRNGVIKPSYNAFKALTRLSEPDSHSTIVLSTQQPPDHRVVAVSTINKGRTEVRTIISNFAPEDAKFFHKIFYIYLGGLVKDKKEYSDIYLGLESMTGCVKEGNSRNKAQSIKEILSSCIEKLPKEKRELLKPIAKGYECFTSPSAGKCMQSVINDTTYKDSDTKQKLLPLLTYMKDNFLERDVRVTYTDLPFDGKVSITTYMIDDENSNACRLNKRTEPEVTSTPCGVNGIIDEEIQKARQKSRKEALEEYLSSSGYSEEQMKKIVSQIANCLSTHERSCLEDVAQKYKLKKEDLNKIQALYDRKYFDYVERINAMEGIALEKSLKKSKRDITDKKLLLDLSMKPNSVSLIIITKDTSVPNRPDL